jgi:hypothetical protein
MISSILKKIGFFVVSVYPFIVTVSAQNLANAETAEGSKPTLFVYLERQIILQSDSVKAEIRFSNNDNYSLTEANLSVIQPSFLILECANPNTNCLKLGSIPAHSTVSRTLYLKSEKDVIIRDYNIAFIVDYKWKILKSGKNVNGQSFIVVEQPLGVKFLGSDSIAGVPLGIATLILPGLSCLLVLSLMRISWIPELPLGEKMLYSVLTSIVILTVGNKYLQLSLNPAHTISIDILATSSLLGAGIGLGLGLLYWLGWIGLWGWQQYQVREDQKLQINPEDDIYTLLTKMISLNKNIDSQQKALISLNNGEQHVGSLYVQQGDDYWLVGWFMILPPDDLTEEAKNTRDKIASYLEEKKLLDAIELARQSNFEITCRESIFCITNNDPPVTNDWEKKTWKQNEVKGSSYSADTEDLPLLQLPQNDISSSLRRTAGT